MLTPAEIYTDLRTYKHHGDSNNAADRPGPARNAAGARSGATGTSRAASALRPVETPTAWYDGGAGNTTTSHHHPRRPGPSSPNSGSRSVQSSGGGDQTGGSVLHRYQHPRINIMGLCRAEYTSTRTNFLAKRPRCSRPSSCTTREEGPVAVREDAGSGSVRPRCGPRRDQVFCAVGIGGRLLKSQLLIHTGVWPHCGSLTLIWDSFLMDVLVRATIAYSAYTLNLT